MKRVHETEGELKLYVVYSRIKETRTFQLTDSGWELIYTGIISKNSADYKIKNMINSLIENEDIKPSKIFLITEDKGFSKISKKIIERGIQLEIITGKKNPQWIKDLNMFQQPDTL